MAELAPCWRTRLTRKPSVSRPDLPRASTRTRPCYDCYSAAVGASTGIK